MDSQLTLCTGVYPAISPSNFSNALTGKIALVTGSGRGIGRAITITLARAGAAVAVTARSAEQVTETARQIHLLGDQTHLVSEVYTHLHGPIDILVCCAGSNTFLPFSCTYAFDWWAEVELNLRAPVELTRLVLPRMRVRNSGTIIFVSSRTGNANLPFTTAYNASKSGLNRFAGTLQAELDIVQTLPNPSMKGEGGFLKNGISVFSIHPGEIETELHETAFKKARSEAPWMVEMLEKKFAESKMPKFDAELPAWSCVWLCSGRGRSLRGGFVDCTRDLEEQARRTEEEGNKEVHQS